MALSVGKARLLFGKDFGAMDQWADIEITAARYAPLPEARVHVIAFS